MIYKNADMSVLADEMKDCQKRLDEYVKSGISLDLSRGKPSAEQLELSLKMLDVLDHRSILDRVQQARAAVRFHSYGTK